MTGGERIQLGDVKRDIEDLRSEVADLAASTKELVKAWEAAGTLVKFVKWASTFVTAVGVLWVAAKYFFGWTS